jgi:WD40 repeat protein
LIRFLNYSIRKIKTSVHTSHRANIFSAKFLPKSDDERLISCSADGCIYLTDINCSEKVNSEHLFSCHGNKTCYEVRTFLHDPFIFISCGQDGCCKWVDLRQTSKCEKQFCQEHNLIKLSTGVSAIAINPFVPYHLVSAGLDGIVRFFDRRMLSVGSHDSVETISSLTDQSTRGLFATFGVTSTGSNSPTATTCNIPGNTVTSNKRITSLQYDNWGSQLLVSYQTNNIYLLDWRVSRIYFLKFIFILIFFDCVSVKC